MAGRVQSPHRMVTLTSTIGTLLTRPTADKPVSIAMLLTVEGIHKAIHAPFFFDNPLQLAVVEEATRQGYVVRISHTQAQWLDDGLERATNDLPLKEPVRKGLIAYIFRSAAHGPSTTNMLHHVQQVVVVGPGVPPIFEATDEMPAVEVGYIKFGGTSYPHLKPAGLKKWFMFGGDLVYTSDSRFTELFGGPLKLHDRCEE